MFPSGTTAMQTYRTGGGDLLLGGDLPGVNYWLANNGEYRLIAALARDPKGYLLTANKSVQKPQDLKGKTIAIRVGSTVDWFMSEYLTKNGLSAKDVIVKNLDGTVMPAALCRGDIDAFFYWQPHNDKAIEICPDKAHNVSDAQGYIPGYVIAAARPAWLANPENAKTAVSFLRAAIKGKDVAERDYASVLAYGKEKYSMEEPVVQTAWKNNFRMITLNDITWKDYCSMVAWMRQEGALKDKFDLSKFVWTDGLKAIDAKLVTEPPPPC
jgi:ABC-type nitrate/sulfonate/bicarbonate transport system substrate-binding protein